MEKETLKITWIEPYYDLILQRIPIDCKTVLDVGAGSGIFGYILRVTRPKIQKLETVEPFVHYPLKHYDCVYNMTWKDWFAKNLNNHYDILVATEVIEHMDKKDAVDFLENSKSIAKKVIVATPIFFENQGNYDNNPFQEHKCLMNINDFKKAGFKTYIVASLNIPKKFKISSRIWYNTRLRRFMKLFNLKDSNIIAIFQN